MRVSCSTSVIDFAGSGILVELPEHIDQIAGVDVIADLLTGVAEHGVGQAFDTAAHEV